MEKKQRICPECGAEFVPVRGNQIYCSRPCQIRSNNRKYQKQKIDGAAGAKSKGIGMAPLEKMDPEDLLHYGKMQKAAQLRGKKKGGRKI